MHVSAQPSVSSPYRLRFVPSVVAAACTARHHAAASRTVLLPARIACVATFALLHVACVLFPRLRPRRSRGRGDVAVVQVRVSSEKHSCERHNRRHPREEGRALNPCPGSIEQDRLGSCEVRWGWERGWPDETGTKVITRHGGKRSWSEIRMITEDW